VVDYSRGIADLPLPDPAAAGLELLRAAFQMMGAVPGRGAGAVELGGELAEAAYLFVAAACRASLPIDAWRVVTRDLLQGCVRPLADFCAASAGRQPVPPVQMRVTAAAAHCLRTALYVCPRELDLGLLLFSPGADGGTASVGDLLLRMADSVAPASDAAGGAAAGIRIIKAEAALCVAIVASYSLAHQAAVARAAASLAGTAGGGDVSASVPLQRAAIAVRDVDASVFVGWTMLDTRGSVVDGSHDDAFADALRSQPQDALRTNGDLRRAAFVKYVLVRSLFGCIQRCHAPEPAPPRSPARVASPAREASIAPAPDPRAEHFIGLVLRLCTAGAARQSPPRVATAQVRELADRAGFSKSQRAKALQLLSREAPRARVEPHKRHWSLADVQRGDLLWFSIVVPDLETAHIVQAADSQAESASRPRLARRAALHVLSASIAAAITATQEHLLRINHHAQICPVRALSRRTFLLDLLNNVLPALVHLLEFLAASLREAPDDFSRRLFEAVSQGAPVALGEVDDDESVAGCVRYRFASLTPENFLTTCDTVRG
jgi:pyruvate/2-oxoglutarate dehydrogenase complex dihydrolipoamide acyltransferase (E2) component